MSWNTGEEQCFAKECSWAGERRAASIWITPEVHAVIKKLCEDVKSEWQMLLTGTENKDGVWVTGYWIPKQEVTAASVKNLDCIDADVIRTKGIIATIHSHAEMGVFFSTTDVECTNSSLIKNHIVVNNKGEMKATMRYELPCGMMHFFDTTAKVISPIVEAIEGVENITKKTYEHTTFYPAGKTWHDNDTWNTKQNKNGKKKKKRHHAIVDKERGYTNEHGVQFYH